MGNGHRCLLCARYHNFYGYYYFIKGQIGHNAVCNWACGLKATFSALFEDSKHHFRRFGAINWITPAPRRNGHRGVRQFEVAAEAAVCSCVEVVCKWPSANTVFQKAKPRAIYPILVGNSLLKVYYVFLLYRRPKRNSTKLNMKMREQTSFGRVRQAFTWLPHDDEVRFTQTRILSAGYCVHTQKNATMWALEELRNLHFFVSNNGDQPMFDAGLLSST